MLSNIMGATGHGAKNKVENEGGELIERLAVRD
jgi:hypothetical protein